MNAFLAVCLPLLIAYTTAWSWCIDRWNAPTEYFAHCWLVPLVAAAVVFARREQWRTVAAAPDRRALWLLVPALLLHLLGLQLMIDSWSAASLCLAVPGAAWLTLGLARLRGLWPVVWLVLFLVPLPIFVEGRLAFTLKEVAVTAGSWLGNLLGAAVVRSGDHLRLPGGNEALYVADACGGLRSLLAMVTITYCLAFFTGPPSWWRRLLLLLVAAPVAVAANVVRIAVLCLFARHFGVPFAEGTGHTLANVAEWSADLAVLFCIDALLRRGSGASPAPAPTVRLPEHATALVDWRPRASLRGPAIVLWLLAGPMLWLGLHRPFAVGTGRAEGLPHVLAAYAEVPRGAAEDARFQRNLPRWWELLGTKDFVWRRYRDADNKGVQLVGLFHDTNWKSVHPPRICIEGSAMDIETDEVIAAPWLGESGSVGRIVARSRNNGRRFVTLSLFGTATWSSGSYGEFVWYHLPRALLRRNESGFLLRVESLVGGGEDMAAAEARCVECLRELVPAARGLLR